MNHSFIAGSSLHDYFPMQEIFNVLLLGVIFGAGIPIIYSFGILAYSHATDRPRESSSFLSSLPATPLKIVAYALFLVCSLLILSGILWVSNGTIASVFGVDLRKTFLG